MADHRHRQSRKKPGGVAARLLPIAVLTGLAAAGLFAGRGLPERIAIVAEVIDGDTFRLAGGERIRIAGIDAPATRPGLARCARERRAGAAATRAARLAAGRSFVLARVGKSDDRTVARVMLDGRDAAGLLLATGAARWWRRHIPKPDGCGGGA